ncbi:MAG: DUF58 domain-containing protein [Bacteroidia bacterium]|nr:DUF58 domain-containing protein [Bacteroidia bacterium]
MNGIFDIQQLQQFDNLEFIAREVVEGFITGLHKSPFHGFSVEFAEHRLYNSGESTRHIDWKLYARTERLYVKRYEEETNLRSHIVIDNSSSMLFPQTDNITQTKLAFSVYCAASLIYLLRKQRDAVGLTLFSDDIEISTQAKLAAVHAKLLYAELNRLLNSDQSEQRKSTNAPKVLHYLAENLHKRSLIIIFSDMLDNGDPEDIFSALQHLRHNKHEVILFHVTDHKREKEFDYNNIPHKFIDLETGNEVKFNPNDVREFYTESMRNYFNSIKLKCGQYHIDLVEADTNDEFRKVLLPFLIKRSKYF